MTTTQQPDTFAAVKERIRNTASSHCLICAKIADELERGLERRVRKLRDAHRAAAAANRVDQRFGNNAAKTAAKLHLDFANELTALLGDGS